MSVRFAAGWPGIELGPYRPAGIYRDDAYSSLPPLPEHCFDGMLGWLPAKEAGPDAHYVVPNPVLVAGLQSLDRRLFREGLALPTAFVTFMSSDVLQSAVPDVCFCSTTPRLVRSPIEEHAYLVSFLCESQGCYYWYLYLGSDGGSFVIGSPSLYEPPGDDDVEDIAPSAFLHETILVAAGFEQFIYRFWIENVAWYQVVYDGRGWDDLSPAARGYLDHYV